MEAVVYWFGLIVVLTFLIFGLDDLLWDIICVLKGVFSTNKVEEPPFDLDDCPHKDIAIIIGAYDESSVIEQVVDNMVRTSTYPRDKYHIFVGVYPNDKPTIKAAKRLKKKHKNVHVVKNVKEGPTSKAQNINNVVNKIRKWERKHNIKFCAIGVHDAEDVMHPYEIKSANYLLNTYDALQFPVFPILEYPTFRNFFKQMTTATYADEFCENHYRMLRTRDSMNGVVPSAGTGFYLSRKILDTLGWDNVLTEGSLTEDYKLSITLQQIGFHIHYVLSRVERIYKNGKRKYDYIAVRSLFPKTFKTAVKQKTRWIYGITFQSTSLVEVIHSNLSLAGKYTVYKDLKAKIGNLILLPGYIVFIYFILSFFIPLPVIYPMFTVSWWLSLLLSMLMIYRQVLRIIAIYNIYGFRSVFFGCLLPPLMPIRLVWGNCINITATIKAYMQHFKIGGIKKKAKKTAKWVHTDHEFLSPETLSGYARTLGDELIRKKYITPEELQKALLNQNGNLLGQYLVSQQIITEDQLSECLFLMNKSE